MFEAPEGAAVKPPAIFQLIITILSEAFSVMVCKE